MVQGSRGGCRTAVTAAVPGLGLGASHAAQLFPMPPYFLGEDSKPCNEGVVAEIVREIETQAQV